MASIAATSYGVTDYGWQPLTLLNGWVADTTPRTVNGVSYAPATPAYRATANFVWFQGELLPPPGLSIGSVMFQLPVEARREQPATTDYTVGLVGASTLAALLPAAALLRKNGNVEHMGIQAGLLGTLQRIFLNEMSYPR